MTFKTRRLSSALSKSAQSCSFILSAFNRHNAQRYPFLLSSSAIKQNNTQYDILIAFPQYDLTLSADKSLSCSNPEIKLQKGFLDTLEALLENSTVDVEQSREGSELPFTGGWFVYLSYEMAEEIEPHLDMSTLPSNQPLAVASRCPVAIVVDKENKQCIAVAETAYAHLLDDIESDLLQISKHVQEGNNNNDENVSLPKVELTSLIESDPAPYLLQVEKIKQYIVDGDIFQANLSSENGQQQLKYKV